MIDKQWIKDKEHITELFGLINKEIDKAQKKERLIEHSFLKVCFAEIHMLLDKHTKK